MERKAEENAARAAGRIMVKTLWSTTWRMIGSVTVLFLIGLALDLNAGTKPNGMIIGTTVGILLAVGLVWKQLKDIQNEKKGIKNGR